MVIARDSLGTCEYIVNMPCVMILKPALVRFVVVAVVRVASPAAQSF